MKNGTTKTTTAKTTKDITKGLKLTAKKAAKVPAPVPPAAKAKEAKASAELTLRLYGKGEFYLPRLAAERLGEHKFIAVEVRGKTVTLTPTKDKAAQPVKFCHASPVLRCGRILAETGWSKATQNLAVTPVGAVAMKVEIK